jgi:hypothetical protein
MFAKTRGMYKVWHHVIAPIPDPAVMFHQPSTAPHAQDRRIGFLLIPANVRNVDPA